MPIITSPTLLAATWMLGALISFVTMAISARELSGALGCFQLVSCRSAIGLVVLVLILTKQGWQQISVTHLTRHLLRNGAHLTGQLAWFYAIGFIPLAAVFALEFTTPVWTAIFAAILLGERFTHARVMAIVLSVLGVLVILHPGSSLLHPSALIMLAGAITYGLAHTLTKSLSQHDTALCILFYMMLIQFILSLIPTLFNWSPIAVQHIPWLLTLGLTGLSGHFCMVRALKHADAMIVVPMDLLRLPLIAIVAYIAYGEQLDMFLLLGAGLILLGNLSNVWLERRAG